MEDGKPVYGSLFIYAPNRVAPIVFAVLFTGSFAAHAWQCKHYRCWKLTWLFPVCCMLFILGFIMRELGAFDYLISPGHTAGPITKYLLSTIFIYCSPPLLELANYHILGRILYYIPYNSPIHPGRVLTTFGFLSTLVEVFNAIGIAYAVNPVLPARLINLGNALMKTSLVLQIIVVALFFILAVFFQRRCIKGGVHTSNVRNSLLTLYASSAIILVRTIYRTVEFFGGESLANGSELSNISPLLRYEWFFWVFEATIMFLNVLLWNVRHPRRYLPQDYRVYLAKDGITEVQGPGWKESDDLKAFFMTFIDPFGLLNRGKKGEKPAPFWETDGIERPGKEGPGSQLRSADGHVPV